MVRNIKKKISAIFLVMTIAISSIILPIFSNVVNAAQTDWKFDLGAVTQSGYTSVTANTAYSSSVGYGFRNTSGVKNVSASGSGALSDAVQFTDTENQNNTFDVDLPNGLYSVKVTLGDTNRTSVYMENMLQIVNMTGNNAVDEILIPITDGQLNIRAAAGKAGYAFSISSIEISLVSTDTAMPNTVWMCGDSTVCNYYPLENSIQAGWGQVLESYLDTGVWQVRNMAASGQYAKGFVDAGQFDAIEYYGKKGDIFIISIGINDTNYSNAEEYYTYVTDMAKKAIAKGMKVILVKQQGRATDVTNNPNLKGRWFGTTLDQIGQELNLQVIDLFNLFFDYCKSIGQDATTALYMSGDTLHPNRQGAMKLAELAASQIDFSIKPEVLEGDEIAEDTVYMIKNKNSGLFLEAESSENAANVSQQYGNKLDKSNLWTVKKSSDGYYYICSLLENGKYYLDLTNGAANNGTNIGVFENTNSDAQLFKFVKNGDRYNIVTKSSNDKSCIEIVNAVMDIGGNAQQWELNGHDCQLWTLEKVNYSENIKNDIIKGDLNGDKKVDVFDYIELKKCIYSDSYDVDLRQAGDTNSDGELSIDDCNEMNDFIQNSVKFDSVEKRSSFYYANEVSFSKGAYENVNSGFKKNSYVNLDNVKGSFIEWNIYAPEAGNYLCNFTIANGSDINRAMKIEVNGNENYWIQDFMPTGNWTTWNTRGIVLPLNKGINKIRMTSDTEQGGPNIDTLYIEKTEEPIAEIYVPNEEEIIKPTENAVIYIAGDSTVQTYRASYAPQQGWGACLQDKLPEGITVSNHAIAGRSSKSFYDNGRLDTILNQMNKGDYLLIQFGINDSAYNNAERYAPVSGQVPGTDGSFEYYIAKYIEGALEKGGTPVLVTTVLGLKAYNSSTGKFDGSYSNYCDAMKKLAGYYNIPCIDLNALMVEHYNSIGYDKAYTYHLISTELSDTDMTHFTETGANAVAELVADKLNDILKKY